MLSVHNAANLQVLVIQTDGGPDRNNQFVAVYLAYLALALVLNCKVLILKRTAPGQSYVNPVERIMSVINLCLCGLALERLRCRDETEELIKGCNSMKARRKALIGADRAAAAYRALAAEAEPTGDACNSSGAQDSAGVLAVGSAVAPPGSAASDAQAGADIAQSFGQLVQPGASSSAGGDRLRAVDDVPEKRSHEDEFLAAMQHPINLVTQAAEVCTRHV